MNNKQIVAAALALSLTVVGTTTSADEARPDLGSQIQQVFAEIHVGNADWKKMVVRIDQLVARIDQQVLDGIGDFEELDISRRRLVNARVKIHQQHLTAAHNPGEAPIGSNVLDPLAPGGYSGGGGGYSGGGGGGGGFGGFGGIGMLGGLAAAIAVSTGNNNNTIGFIASPSN